MPDIDLDFPRDVREQLIPRIHERYGPERSALVCAFPTFRVKGAVRELGKALGLPPTEIERVARSVDGWAGENFESDVEVAVGGKRADSTRWKALVRLVREAWGLPRHASQHSGGMVLATRPLNELCPIVPAAMEGRQIVMWDKDSCADAGFLKIDLLGLGMLSAVERCVDEVARTRNERLDLSRIRLDDPEVYDAIRNAETTGVFQIESRAQMQMLPRITAGEPGRSDGAGGAGAPGPDPGRRGPPLPRPQGAPSRGSGLRHPLRASGARADPLRHAGGDRLPGPGDPGGDGARRLLGRRGGGPAAGDEPQALRRGDGRVRGALRRGRGDERRAARVRRRACSSRCAASRASAFRSRTRRRSASSPTSRRGCGCIAGPSSCARS